MYGLFVMEISVVTFRLLDWLLKVMLDFPITNLNTFSSSH